VNAFRFAIQPQVKSIFYSTPLVFGEVLFLGFAFCFVDGRIAHMYFVKKERVHWKTGGSDGK